LAKVIIPVVEGANIHLLYTSRKNVMGWN